MFFCDVLDSWFVFDTNHLFSGLCFIWLAQTKVQTFKETDMKSTKTTLAKAIVKGVNTKSLLSTAMGAALLFGANANATDINYGQNFFIQGLDDEYVAEMPSALVSSKYGLSSFSWQMVNPVNGSDTSKVEAGDVVVLKSKGGRYITERADGDRSTFSATTLPDVWVDTHAARFVVEKALDGEVWRFKSVASGNRFTSKAGLHTDHTTHFIPQPAIADYNADCNDHEYGLLLTRVAREAKNTSRQYDISIEDVQSTGYFDTVLNTCTNTNAWQQIEQNAQIRVVEKDGHYIRVVLSKADNEAYVAFPGVTTESFTDVLDSGYQDWPGAAGGDVHKMFYGQWQAIDSKVSNWLSASAQNHITKVNLAGHSRGGVLAQYMVADLGNSTLANVEVDLALFGSPNAGNDELTQAWCNMDSLKNAEYYVTRFKYEGWDIARRKWYDDIMAWRDIDSGFTGFIAYFAGLDAYPRGLGRDTSTRLTDMCGQLKRREINVDIDYGSVASDAYWVEVEQSASDVHGTSYYLANIDEKDLVSYDVKKLTRQVVTTP